MLVEHGHPPPVDLRIGYNKRVGERRREVGHNGVGCVCGCEWVGEHEHLPPVDLIIDNKRVGEGGKNGMVGGMVGGWDGMGVGGEEGS